ncbi:MAG: hypothetical protein ABI132_04075, partial [Rhodanobacteraceae bacterium]
MTAQELNRLVGDGCQVLHDVPGEKFNLDHVLGRLDPRAGRPSIGDGLSRCGMNICLAQVLGRVSA